MILNIRTIVIFLLLSCGIEGQNIEIENVTISRVALKIDELHEEQESEGPIFTYQIKFVNNSDSILRVYPSESKFEQFFRYKNKLYSSDVVSSSLLPFLLNKKVIEISKGDSSMLKFSARILLGTNIRDSIDRDYDYTKEIMQILPTLRIVYKDKCNRFQSSGINNVTIGTYTYTPK